MIFNKKKIICIYKEFFVFIDNKMKKNTTLLEQI